MKIEGPEFACTELMCQIQLYEIFYNKKIWPPATIEWTEDCIIHYQEDLDEEQEIDDIANSCWDNLDNVERQNIENIMEWKNESDASADVFSTIVSFTQKALKHMARFSSLIITFKSEKANESYHVLKPRMYQ